MVQYRIMRLLLFPAGGRMEREGWCARMEKILKQLLEGQKELFEGQKELFEGQKRLMEEQMRMSARQDEFFAVQEKLVKGQEELFAGQDKLVRGQDELFAGQDKLFTEVAKINARLDEMPTKADLERTIAEQQKDVIAILERTATKDSVLKVDTKIDLINNKLFQTETEIALLKLVK